MRSAAPPAARPAAPRERVDHGAARRPTRPWSLVWRSYGCCPPLSPLTSREDSEGHDPTEARRTLGRLDESIDVIARH